MIITKTPYRISFFGGGSDYPSWYRKNGGSVLSTTIDKYIYISCRFSPKYFKHKYRIVWRKIENVQKINEINHKAVRELLKYLRIKPGLEIHYYGDLPARSGMGSSSSFTVGLMQALYRIKKVRLTKEKLANKIILLSKSKSQIKFISFDDSLRNRKEIINRAPDISKAIEMLGYKPEVTLDDVLTRVIKKHSNC